MRVGNGMLARPLEHNEQLAAPGSDQRCRPACDVAAAPQRYEVVVQEPRQRVVLPAARPVRGKRELGRHGEDSRGYHRDMAIEPLQHLLQQAFPDATEVRVEDRTGGGDHFQVIVSSPRFDGLPLLEQHRLVNDALAEPLRDGTIHELRIKTKGSG